MGSESKPQTNTDRIKAALASRGATQVKPPAKVAKVEPPKVEAAPAKVEKPKGPAATPPDPNSKTSRRKRVAADRRVRPRLPDGAKVEAVYFAERQIWEGSLTVGEIKVSSKRSGLFSLLMRLDDKYREATTAAVVINEGD